MELPKQVEEAAQLAEDLMNQINPEQKEVVSEESKQEQVADEPKQEEQEVVQPEPEPKFDYEAELKKAEQRWKTLQGMMEHEKKEKELIKAQLEEIKQSVTKKEPDPISDEISAFEEEYGSDFVNQIRKLIAKEAGNLVQQPIEKVTEKVQSMEDTQVQVAQTNFMNYLDTKVEGDWQNLWNGNDPKFMEFLEKPDPSGLYTYGQLMSLYNDNWDGDKMAVVFNTYLKESQPAPKPEPVVPNREREAMIAPSRTASQATPNAEDKKVWTMAEIGQFQKDDIQGKYSLEQSQAIWNDVLAAMSDGRIIK